MRLSHIIRYALPHRFSPTFFGARNDWFRDPPCVDSTMRD
jgi:hypothetical protein